VILGGISFTLNSFMDPGYFGTEHFHQLVDDNLKNAQKMLRVILALPQRELHL
jgi:hypothetical protein